MKRITYVTYLRPAILSDLFDKDGYGKIIENKQFFYKELDKTINGPYRIYEPNSINYQFYYQEIISLLNQERIFIVDTERYLESFLIKLTIKEVEEADIIENKHLIYNTSYFQKQNNKVLGPFYITNETKVNVLKTLINSEIMFVFDKPSIIKKYLHDRDVA